MGLKRVHPFDYLDGGIHLALHAFRGQTTQLGDLLRGRPLEQLRREL